MFMTSGSASYTGAGVAAKNLMCYCITYSFPNRIGCLIPLFMEYPAKVLLYSKISLLTRSSTTF